MKKFCLCLLKIMIVILTINFIAVETFTTSLYLTNNVIIITYTIFAFLACCMLVGWLIFSYSRIYYIITGIFLIIFFSMYNFEPQIVDAHIQQYEIECG